MTKQPPAGTSMSTVAAGNIFRLANWFGLIFGLLEGIGLVSLQELGWLSWRVARVGVSIEIVWISALFNLLVFALAAAGLVVAGGILPKLPLLRVSLLSFLFMGFLDLLLLSGWIRDSAALVLAAGLATAASRWFRSREGTTLRLARRTLRFVVATMLLAAVGIEGGLRLLEWRATEQLPPAPSGMRNVLLIVVDTLRADHLGCYGYARPTSPSLDRLSKEGALFEAAFATSSWTLPSHASLLTGHYPSTIGALDDRLPAGSPTLAEEFRNLGYRTAAVSANTTWFIRRRGFGRGFLHFADFFNTWGDMAARTVYGRKIEAYVLRFLGFEDDIGRKFAVDVNRSLLAWLDRDPHRPFFAVLNYYDVHDPYLPPQPYRSRFSQSPNPGGVLNTRLYRYYPQMTPEQLQGEVDAYDGGIAYVDWQIGELIAALARRGLSENTVVVITSDHGESFGEHGLLLHLNALYREVLHVPLIVWAPGRVRAGVRVAEPVSIASIPATVIELAGGTKHPFPGRSLAGLWAQAGEKPLNLTVGAELGACRHEAIRKNPCYHGPMKAAVSLQWHFVEHEKLPEEIYSWRQDPEELHNLIDDSEGRRAAAELRSWLREFIGRDVPDPTESPSPLDARRIAPARLR